MSVPTLLIILSLGTFNAPASVHTQIIPEPIACVKIATDIRREAGDDRLKIWCQPMAGSK